MLNKGDRYSQSATLQEPLLLEFGAACFEYSDLQNNRGFFDSTYFVRNIFRDTLLGAIH